LRVGADEEHPSFDRRPGRRFRRPPPVFFSAGSGRTWAGAGVFPLSVATPVTSSLVQPATVTDDEGVAGLLAGGFGSAALF